MPEFPLYAPFTRDGSEGGTQVLQGLMLRRHENKSMHALRGIESAFIGVLGKNPEIRQGKNGKPYCNFSCVVSGDAGDPQWINTICFGETAEMIAGTAHKGDKVYCEGSLSLATWETGEGNTRSGLAVSAWKVEKLGCIGMSRAEPPKPSHEIVKRKAKRKSRVIEHYGENPYRREKPKIVGIDDFDFNDPLPF